MSSKNKEDLPLKILIIGFQRSGSMLLADLISKHPDVKDIFFDVGIISGRTQSEILDLKELHKVRTPTKVTTNEKEIFTKATLPVTFDLNEANWGERVVYYQEQLIHFTKPFISPITYIKQWREHFGEDALVLHIIRHPLDVALSSERLNGQSVRPLKQMMLVVPKLMLQISVEKLNYVQNVKFESLVTAPKETLIQIFKRIGVNTSEEMVEGIMNNPQIIKYGQIQQDRAFTFLQENANTDLIASIQAQVKIKKDIIKLMNIFPGPKYQYPI